MKKLPLKLVLLLIAMCLSHTAIAAKNILLLGDSLSAGYGIPLEKSWPNLLSQELVRTQSSATIVNASISGETTQGGVTRISKLLQQFQPKIVIVELGANDGLRGYNLAETERNLNEIIRQIIHSNAKALLIGMKIPPNYGESYTTQFQELYARIALKNHILLVPFLLEGVSNEQFQPDNLHPIANAQQQIMLNVLKELKHLLH